MKRKKFGTLLLAGTLVFSMTLAGCGKAEAGSSPASASSTSSESGQAEPKHLVMVFPGSTPKDLADVNKALSDYTKSKINATVELRPIDWGKGCTATALPGCAIAAAAT